MSPAIDSKPVIFNPIRPKNRAISGLVLCRFGAPAARRAVADSPHRQNCDDGHSQMPPSAE
jgi:hypothetical protein